ncbi:MAG: hypothetical protein Kilf2KO_49030 [Rhodospirillales bacterium]
MTLLLSRRRFGLLSAALGATALPSLSWAASPVYANMHLLMEPTELRRRPTFSGASKSDDDSDAILLVDVRPRAAFDAGHIAGAHHLDPNAVVAGHSPVDGSLQALPAIEALLSALGISADRRVVLYDDQGGFHAARMFWLLEYLGHRKVSLLNGGLTAWMALDGTLTQDTHDPAAASFQAAPSPRRHATADYILAHRNDENTLVVDVRPAKVHAAGHIPWAINVPWSQNRAEDMRFKSAEDLMAHFKAQGITPQHNVVLHCQTGLASAHSYVALRLLGFPRVRVYHRSWAEWGSDPSLPRVVS